ncbi:phosphoribosylformylglycinamidine synthase subunit PurL [Plantactinospora siamensis]|uniref:Phosphoribosylformylglycinamidine synthase subunit PurL n=1 Tax=Plantactinospora siamensis TaxID=555372 RepID=A0ABV6NRI7_9ACTN
MTIQSDAAPGAADPTESGREAAGGSGSGESLGAGIPAGRIPTGSSGGEHASREQTELDGVDTVDRAAGTPEELQPYPELGLHDDEYDRIRQMLGRRPTQSELAMYSIMWSEHCSYKSSKVHLRQFGEKAPPSEHLLAGIGENAGVVRVSDRLAVTFKVESHNHPSFVEPYQGAATGVGGIVRDILAMGARPVAVMDALRFGAADHPDTARVLPGVVAGVGGYGNCLGLPNIGGEVVFDDCYQGNPLVNALCLGVLPVDRLQNKAAAGVGNVVVLMGAKTGRDGIGGVSVLASATFEEGGEGRRPSVQVGDPFMEKLLIEACLELYDAQLVVGIQDLGGAGLTCALTETAAAAGTGMRVVLDRVPLREPSMLPHEILASESQERMLLIVAPEKLEAVLKTAAKWGVPATAIGEVTPAAEDGTPGRLLITWRDRAVVDVPPATLVDDGPVYARPLREPADRILFDADRAETLPRPNTPEALRETVLRMITAPNLCDKTWVTEQYDRYVLGNTVLAQPEDAGVIRIDEQSGLGVALSLDGNGRYTRLDPYSGAKLALAEAYRNVAVTGARPLAVTNCLNFGSPEDPAVMWQFAEAVRGLADGCAELGIPVTGGNVSFYNSTGAAAIHPTPVVGVLGVIDDVADRVRMGFVRTEHLGDELIFLLGETRAELSGSEWASVVHGHLGGPPPEVDLARERALAELLAEANRVGHLRTAHDLSDGGLSQALIESCLRYGVGARIALPAEFTDGTMPFVYLFSESTGRVLVTVPRGQDKAFTALCDEFGVPWTGLGVTDPAGGVLEIRDQFRIGLDELREAFTGTLPMLFGGAAEAPRPAGTVPTEIGVAESAVAEPVETEPVVAEPVVAESAAEAVVAESAAEPTLVAEAAPAPESASVERAAGDAPVRTEPADGATVEPTPQVVTEPAPEAATAPAAESAAEPVGETADTSGTENRDAAARHPAARHPDGRSPEDQGSEGRSPEGHGSEGHGGQPPAGSR